MHRYRPTALRRGGTGVKYYELSDGDRPGSSLPEVHFCHEYKATGPPLSGMALLPPQCLDVGNVEVARVMRLTPTTVEPGGARDAASAQGHFRPTQSVVVIVVAVVLTQTNHHWS